MIDCLQLIVEELKKHRSVRTRCELGNLPHDRTFQYNTGVRRQKTSWFNDNIVVASLSLAEIPEAAVDASLLPGGCTQLDWSQVYMTVTSGGYYCRSVSIFDVDISALTVIPARHRRHLPAIICRKRSRPRDPELFSECRSLRSPRARPPRAHRIDGLMVLSVACQFPFSHDVDPPAKLLWEPCPCARVACDPY